jgi:hypothetical protein
MPSRTLSEMRTESDNINRLTPNVL